MSGFRSSLKKGGADVISIYAYFSFTAHAHYDVANSFTNILISTNNIIVIFYKINS